MTHRDAVQAFLALAVLLANAQPAFAAEEPQANTVQAAVSKTQNNAQPEPSAQSNLPTEQKPETPARTPAVLGAPASAPAPQTAIAAADYIAIDLKPGEHKYRLQQFELKLQNKQDKHIELLQLEVVNGISGESYAQIQQEQAGAKRRLAGGVLRGLTSVATSFVPYAGVGSYAAYQGIYAGTQAAHATASALENSGAGNAATYAGQVTQRANNVIVSPNQTFQCLAVVPEKQTPVVKVIFKDLQSNQIFEYQQ